MIYLGSNEIAAIKLGNTDISAIYAGDLLIWPTDFGNLTAITFEDLTWETDIPSSGGTATSANCSFEVYALFDSGKRKRVTSATTVTGSLVVPSTLSPTRESAGTLTLTASYSGFTDTGSVTVYQAAKTYNNIITYETTNNTILTLPTASWSSSIVSHSFNNNVGTIEFANDLTSIPDSAFYACTTLKTIEIPDSVTSYGISSFESCTGMETFTIPSNISSIGSNCFKLTSGVLTIVDNQYAVSGAGRSTAFTDGSSAFNYSFAGKFCGSTYKDYNGINFDKIIITGNTTLYVGRSAFHCSPASEIIVGDNVDFVGGMAFARMTNEGYGTILKPLTSFTMGANVQTVGQYLWFYGVSALSTIKWDPDINYSADSGWFGTQGTVYYKSGNTGRISGLPSGWSGVIE